MNKRRFNRIALGSFRNMDLLLNNTHYRNINIKDLSLSGLRAEGDFHGYLCDRGELLLKPMDNGHQDFLRLPCRVTRVDDKGIAVDFLYPDQDSLHHLETIILYLAEDPFSAAIEFPEVAFEPAPSSCI